MRRRSTIKAFVVLFLVAILLTGSASVFFMVSGIFVALVGFVILCLLLLLVAVTHFSKKNK